MTVSSETNQVTYQANGSTTQWSFPFAYVDASTIFVTLTDSEGTSTVISPAFYNVILNPPIGPNPTGAGGIVVYPNSGPPLPLGNAVTISRELEAIQPVSLTNQSIIYPPVIEKEFDYLTMLRQQGVAEASRAFRVGLQDPIPRIVPSVAQRRQQGAFFDANGDLVPGQAPGGAVFISAAMQPVVGAGTLAAARTLMGLGNIATKNIGFGLQDDLAGNVRVNVGIRKISTSQSPLPSLHNSVDVTTGNLTYTLGPANTYFNGFGFYLDSISGRVTIQPIATDSIQGLAAGVSWTIPAGTYVYLQTDGVDTWYLRYYKTLLPTGTTLSGGAGNYVPPLGCFRVRVQMCGGGGGGGNGSGAAGNGGVGGTTSFGGWQALGGNGGAGSQGASAGFAGIGGGPGGANGVGSLILRTAGGDGTCGTPWITPAAPDMLLSGLGGASYFGGGGTNTFNSNTAFGSRVPGAGGGGGPNSGAQNGTGGGGGAGEYVSFWRNIMGVASLPYSVGAAGSASAAGPGTVGVILVEEFYGGP